MMGVRIKKRAELIVFALGKEIEDILFSSAMLICQ